MDACEHEYPSMSRHNRKVPTSFYYRFAQDVCAFSDKYARGRIVSVLEGGYSDRALISGAMAHLSGLADDMQPAGVKAQEEWWNVDNLEKVVLVFFSAH
jgi:histone deacetylase HOS3